MLEGKAHEVLVHGPRREHYHPVRRGGGELRLEVAHLHHDDILDLDDIALGLISELSSKYPERLAERYSLGTGTPLEILEAACGKRGFITRGGGFDFERGMRAVIDDFRKGRLGKITLDDPSDMAELGF